MSRIELTYNEWVHDLNRDQNPIPVYYHINDGPLLFDKLVNVFVFVHLEKIVPVEDFFKYAHEQK